MVIARAALAGLLTALLAACSSTGASRPTEAGTARPTEAAETGGAVRYLALGDSVTSGEGVPAEETYPSRLAALWRAAGCDVEVQNVAVTGYKSADVVAEELPAVDAFKPTLATVMVGANDLANGVGLDEYRANVRAILRDLADAGARIVTISQQYWERTPFAEGYGTPEELGAKRLEFDDVLIEEGRAVGATHVDLRPVFEEQAGQRMWLDDGLHPTGAAYEAWADGVHRAVGVPCGTAEARTGVDIAALTEDTVCEAMTDDTVAAITGREVANGEGTVGACEWRAPEAVRVRLFPPGSGRPAAATAGTAS
ncbi:SGNH/GDSL hydrolase family protein [Actinokineospora soli]|uniref:SGNH/GDSL hydrolase family protein n=1 Tax=Actinokineospora soli TaxID=1048753 RepID=A0ABW2TMZ7_9PSEU